MAEPDTRPIVARPVVLAVDDTPETLSLLVDALEGAGLTALVAPGGAEALELMRHITPDLVLLDAMMPDPDGFETCRRLKATASLTHVPVVFMTALSEPEHIVQGLEAGGVDYVTKPLNLEVLLARIRVHLANARTTRSARAALDTAGRPVLALGPDGTVLWGTPQATALLASTTLVLDGRLSLPRAAAAGLAENRLDGLGPVPLPTSGRTLHLTAVGPAADGEQLVRLIDEDTGVREAALRTRYGLTIREADVLLWIARGKANRDIADILGLSPRTVNKHLEGIYMKMGVENRASAAVLAAQVLADG